MAQWGKLCILLRVTYVFLKINATRRNIHYEKGLPMSPRSKKECLEAIFLRYNSASHKQKSVILDEFCATSGYHRKHAIRLLGNFDGLVKSHITPFSVIPAKAGIQ